MKKKLLAMILIVAVVATLLTSCTLFPVDEERDYHQVVATVDYKDMSKDVLKGDLLNYYLQYGGTYIYYYGWTEAETLEYLCTSLARQNLLLLYAKEYLATQADPDITDAEIAAMKAEDFLTVDERRYCIEQTNKSFEESWRSLITELEEEQAANEGTTDEEEPEEDEATAEEELEARPVRPEEEESDEYVDEGMTDAAQLPKGFMDTVQSEIDAETDATARKNMSTALKELQDNLASGFKDYAYYLNSQYETRILDKYSEALGDALPEITDEELNARYNRLVAIDISKYTDEEAYASALESTSDIYYHTTQGYSQVRSILLKFTDEQTDALETITNMVGDNEDAVEAYRAILALGEDVAGKMPSQFASLADLGIKVNVSNPDYDEEEDELADAYTDKGVDYKVILYAMADYIAAKVAAAETAATAADITGSDLELVKQYAANEAITDWIYLVNDDNGMFDSESYVLSPSGSASSYVEEYTVLGRALAKQGIGSYAIPADSFTDGAAALAYTAAEGKEPTAILNAVNGKTYEIASKTETSVDENGEELSTTVYTLKTEAGNTISFIVNDYGIHIVYVADKFLDASKGDWSDYTVDGKVKGYKLGIGYLHSYEVEFEYAEDEDGNATDTITGVTLTKTTIGEYIKDTIKDERSSAEFSDKQTEIFLDTSKNIIVQQSVYDGLLKEIKG